MSDKGEDIYQNAFLMLGVMSNQEQQRLLEDCCIDPAALAGFLLDVLLVIAVNADHYGAEDPKAADLEAVISDAMQRMRNADVQDNGRNLDCVAAMSRLMSAALILRRAEQTKAVEQ